VNAHRSLPVWRASSDLVCQIYRLTRTLPHRDEQFVSVPQLRRAAWSVSNNIAEGNARRGRGELRQFFNVALGSLAEIDAMVGTLSRLYPVDPEQLATIERLRREITRGLFGILRSCGRGGVPPSRSPVLP
jgi:four helix bundle protein